MAKLVEKHVAVTIIFWVVGLVYGTIFNFILSGEDASPFWSYVKGNLVGFLSGTIYLVLTFFLGHCFNQEYVTDRLRKKITILMNAVALVCMCSGITMIIGNNELITLKYGWVHIVNLLFVGCVVGISNYDGKVLRNFIKESEKCEMSNPDTT